jgi:hypothetical protein
VALAPSEQLFLGHYQLGLSRVIDRCVMANDLEGLYLRHMHLLLARRLLNWSHINLLRVTLSLDDDIGRVLRHLNLTRDHARVAHLHPWHAHVSPRLLLILLVLGTDRIVHLLCVLLL